MQGVAPVPPGPKQAVLMALIEEGVKLNEEEEKRYLKMQGQWIITGMSIFLFLSGFPVVLLFNANSIKP